MVTKLPTFINYYAGHDGTKATILSMEVFLSSLQKWKVVKLYSMSTQQVVPISGSWIRGSTKKYRN